jgi:hypothetical protein
MLVRPLFALATRQRHELGEFRQRFGRLPLHLVAH